MPAFRTASFPRYGWKTPAQLAGAPVLMVLSHVDADHIEGLLELVGADDASTPAEMSRPAMITIARIARFRVATEATP
jgi:hypothetical protein